MGDGAQQAMNLSDDVNPYIPPSSTINATRRRTRWRIGVVTLLLIFGSIGLVATPIPLLVAYSRPAEFGGGFTSSRVLGVFLNAVGSIMWITGGILCWRGRWLSASTGVALGTLAFLGSARLLDDLDL
ncbi:MAG: hypothetical protein ACYC0X_02365 [Pirellulaceae bacterium]